MSLIAVAAAAKDWHHAKELQEQKRMALIKVMYTAVADGVPLAKTARAAGVSRNTGIKWLKELDPDGHSEIDIDQL